MSESLNTKAGGSTSHDSAPLAPSAPRACRIQNADGSSVSQEIQSLRRVRLRAAAVLLFTGFLAFFLKYLAEFTLGGANHWPKGSGFAHLGVVAILFAAIAMLCESHAGSFRRLLMWEAIIFGVPAAFFAFSEWRYGSVALSSGSEDVVEGFVSQVCLTWSTLIFLYGLFIPNTGARAARVVVPLALAPIIVVLGTALSCPCAQGFLMDDTLATMVLWLAIPAASAIWGADTISKLGRQAHVAKQLGSYHLVRKLGVGGMGEVYLAEHRLLKRPCAIKLIRPERSADPQALARFESEVQAAARLTHWNSIEIFDYGRAEDGVFYFVMEYLPGMSLQELVDSFGRLSPARVIHLARQVCAALEEAHAAGLVHRDIKPGNIFAAQRGGIYDVAKLLDFGLVKSVAPKLKSTKLTVEGAVIGSPMYVAPEHAMGEDRADVRSDIYSLGATMYFMLTGKPVFEHENPLKVIFAHVNEGVTPPHEHCPDVPRDLEAVIMRCLEKEPARRFQDVTSLAAALSACDEADKWSPRQAREWWEHVATLRPIDADAVGAVARETTLMEVKV